MIQKKLLINVSLFLFLENKRSLKEGQKEMFKLSLLIIFSIILSIQKILCEDSSEFKSKLLADYNALNRDLIHRLVHLEQQDDQENDDSDEMVQPEKRFPRWGGGIKSLHDLKNNRVSAYEQQANEKRFPKWRNTELKSRLNQPQKFEPFFGENSYPMRKMWEKNLLEKNKIYEKNNLI